MADRAAQVHIGLADGRAYVSPRADPQFQSPCMPIPGCPEVPVYTGKEMTCSDGSTLCTCQNGSYVCEAVGLDKPRGACPAEVPYSDRAGYPESFCGANQQGQICAAWGAGGPVCRCMNEMWQCAWPKSDCPAAPPRGDYCREPRLYCRYDGDTCCKCVSTGSEGVGWLCNACSDVVP